LHHEAPTERLAGVGDGRKGMQGNVR